MLSLSAAPHVCAVTWCRSSAELWRIASHMHSVLRISVLHPYTCSPYLLRRSDLVPLIRWNEAHGIRLFRLSSCILPWMTSYKPEELPDWPQIQAVSVRQSIWLWLCSSMHATLQVSG
jgi:hypothetical protein